MSLSVESCVCVREVRDGVGVGVWGGVVVREGVGVGVRPVVRREGSVIDPCSLWPFPATVGE